MVTANEEKKCEKAVIEKNGDIQGNGGQEANCQQNEREWA